MKSIFSLALLAFLSNILFSQETINKTAYLFSGIIEQSFIFHEGTQRAVTKEHFVTPTNNFSPYADFTFIVIQAKFDTAYFYCKVKTDSNGKFKIKLPKGKYGIWPGSIMPDNPKDVLTNMPHFLGGSGSSKWSINIPTPIEIKDHDIIDVVIKNESEAAAP